jgi:addiction module RelE/StbE family toxin
MYTLRFSKLYDSDIDESYNYIKDTLEAPMAAKNLIKEILEKLQKIKENPHRRPLVQDSYLASLGYRIIHVKNYMIFYIVDDDKKQIKVVRFLYNKRNWIDLLKEENDSR